MEFGRKKILLFLAGAAVIQIGGCWFVLRDEPPPADAHLRSFRRSVKDEENGFRLVDVTAEDVWEDEEEYLLEWFSPTLDLARATELVEKNEAVLAKVDRCLELPEFQVDPFDFTAALPHFGGWKELAGVLAVRARLHLESGRPPEACRDGLRLVRLGRRIRSSQGGVAESLLGMNMESTGLECLVYTALHGTLSPEDIRRILGVLEAERSPVRWLQDALKAEYVAISRTIDALAAGKEVDRDLQRGLGYWALRRPLFKPNQTRRFFCEGIGLLVSAAGLPHGERPSLEQGWMEENSWASRLTGGGRFLASFLIPPYEKSLTHSDLTEFKTRAAGAFFALLLARAGTGTMPDSLGELVPRHLARVPLDQFHGKPLRYSAPEGIIYSVGVDGEDAGGSEREDPIDAFEDLDEPTLRLSPKQWDLKAMEASRREKELEDLKKQVRAAGAVWEEE